jgi:Tfp pilus assembly protein PilV
LTLSTLRSEAGFALIEVMVSAVLLVVISLATYPVLDQSAGRTSSNRARAEAVDLAELDQDRMRAMPENTLRGLDQTYPANRNGVAFSIHSEAKDVNDPGTALTCSATTGTAQYDRITTTVTWPKMNGIDPVVLDSLVSPSLAGANRGTLVLTVQKADASPQPNISVTAGGVTKTTDAAGCAFWTDLPAGQNTITANTPGYVDENGLQAASVQATVVKGDASTKSFMYDLAASVPTSFKDTDTTTTATQWFDVTFLPSNYPFQVRPATHTTLLSALTAAQAGSLFPFTNGYQVYAGGCSGSEPSQYKSDYYTTHPLATAKPLAGTTTTTATAYTRRTALTVSEVGFFTKFGTSTSHYVVKPYTADLKMAGCNETTLDKSGVTGTSSSQTQVTNNIDLPFGVWSVCTDDGKGSSSHSATTIIYNYPTGTTGQTGAAMSSNFSSGTTGVCT